MREQDRRLCLGSLCKGPEVSSAAVRSGWGWGGGLSFYRVRQEQKMDVRSLRFMVGLTGMPLMRMMVKVKTEPQ